MDKTMSLPRMLLIGGEEKDAGKTTLSTKIINKFSGMVSIFAVKITVLRGYDGKKGFSVWEENDPVRNKDTGRLLRAGAKRVFWLKTDEEHVVEGVHAVLKMIPAEAAIICESNIARLVVEPAIFIMVKRDNPTGEKKSAASVKHLVDKFVISSIEGGSLIYKPETVNSLQFSENGWQIAGEGD